MARALTAAFTALLFSAGHASAQDILTVGQPVDVAITAGATHEYTIALDAGDYVAGAVDQRGILVLAAVFTPYRANGTPHALLVLFDEGAYLNSVPTPVILDNLMASCGC